MRYLTLERPYFWWSVLRKYWSGISCPKKFTWGVFLRLSLRAEGGRPQKQTAIFTSIIARAHSSNLTYHCWCWTLISWLRQCFSDFSIVKFLFLPFHIVPFMGGPKINREAILHLLRVRCRMHYLEFFCMGNLSILFFLLIYSTIYLYQSGLMDIYFIFWVIIHITLFFVVFMFHWYTPINVA